MFEPRKKPPVGVHIGYIGGDAVGVRLLKDPAAAGTPRAINEKDVDEVLPLPKSLCPNADHLVCIRVEGDSMSPILEAGYIVAIDTSQVDPRRLHGNMVAARAPDGGVTIKWLRKSGKDLMLIPQHTSMRHQPVVLPATEEDHEWGIVGRVLWWLGTPPK
jgi:SOS-response transcriptional repressor LexA